MDRFINGFFEFLFGLLIFAGVCLVIVAMVFLYKKIIPEKLDGTFSKKWMQQLHDYFNFKKLYLESALKFIFTLATVTAEAGGVVYIVNEFITMLRSFGLLRYGVSLFEILGDFLGGVIAGAAILVFAPIAIRLAYETIMMFILLVKNVTDINDKIGKDK